MMSIFYQFIYAEHCSFLAFSQNGGLSFRQVRDPNIVKTFQH